MYDILEMIIMLIVFEYYELKPRRQKSACMFLIHLETCISLYSFQ